MVLRREPIPRMPNQSGSSPDEQNNNHDPSEGLTARLSSLRSETYPPTVLLPDILDEIFDYLIEPGDKFILPPSVEEYRWRLGRVCSYWRQVLWSNHRRWRFISVQGKRTGQVIFFRSTFQCIDYVLSNVVGTFSLDIERDIKYDMKYWGEEQFSIAKLILPVLSRFKSIRISRLSLVDFQAILHSPVGSLESIETFDVSIDVRQLGKTFRPGSADFCPCPAPRLRNISINVHEPFGFNLPSTIHLPWAQLNTISVQQTDKNRNMMSFLVSNCPCMTELTLTVKEGFAYEEKSAIVHEKLGSLTLVSVPRIFSWEAFFKPFIFPSLASLRIEDCYADWSNLHEPIVLLIVRSKCSLQSLVVSGHAHLPFEPTEIIPLLHQLFACETLKLPHTIPPSVFDEIVGKRLLPHLQYSCWNTEPSGLYSLLDWMDILVARPAHESAPMKIDIQCEASNVYALRPAFRSFEDRVSAYSAAGLTVELRDKYGDVIDDFYMCHRSLRNSNEESNEEEADSESENEFEEA